MRIRHALAGVAAAAVLAVGTSMVPTTAVASPTPAAAGGLTPRAVPIPVSSLSTTAQAALRAQGRVTASDVIWGYRLVNTAYGKCLDANASGSTAGQNGDKVQLWDCNGADNQYWVPWQTTSGYTELVNLKWTDPAMCLDVDTSQGFVNGAKVQLWHCYGDDVSHQNQWWNYLAGSKTALPSLWRGGSKVLDANGSGPSAGQNGDKVQIWDSLGGDNQIWPQPPAV